MSKRETVSLGFVVAAVLNLGCTPGSQGRGSGNSGGTGEGGSGAGDNGGQAGGDGGNSAAAGDTGQAGTGGSDPGGAGKGGGQPVAGGSAGGGRGGTAGSGQAGTGGGAGTQAAAGQGGGSTSLLEPCATNPYCNDFEATAVGARPLGFINVSAGNTMAVAEDKFFSGKRSLAITATSGIARFSVYLQSRLKNPARIGYARMMVWLDNLPGAVGSSHWNIIEMSGQTKIPAGNSSASIAFGGTGGNASDWFIYLGGGADCTKTVRPPPLPLKQWACVEMRVDESTATNYGVSINKTAVSALSLKWNQTGAGCVGGFSNIWYIPDVQTFSFGWNHYHEQNAPIKMWIDDIVVDEKPIGCP